LKDSDPAHQNQNNPAGFAATKKKKSKLPPERIKKALHQAKRDRPAKKLPGLPYKVDRGMTWVSDEWNSH